MDSSALISTLVGGVCTLVGAFGAIWVTNWLDRRKAKKTKRLEKIEAIGASMPQLWKWFNEEADMYWNGDISAPECVYEPRQNRYCCPFDEMQNLVNLWLPSLRAHVEAIGTVVSFYEDLRGRDGAEEYQFEGNLEKLESELRKHNELFKEQYRCLWESIKAEVKKAVPNR